MSGQERVSCSIIVGIGIRLLVLAGTAWPKDLSRSHLPTQQSVTSHGWVGGGVRTRSNHSKIRTVQTFCEVFGRLSIHCPFVCVLNSFRCSLGLRSLHSSRMTASLDLEQRDMSTPCFWLSALHIYKLPSCFFNFFIFPSAFLMSFLNLDGSYTD